MEFSNWRGDWDESCTKSWTRGSQKSQGCKLRTVWKDTVFKLQVWLPLRKSSLWSFLLLGYPNPDAQALQGRASHWLFRLHFLSLCLGPTVPSQSNSCHVPFSSTCSLLLFKISMLMSSQDLTFLQSVESVRRGNLSSNTFLFLLNYGA